jgi:enamine deaminase RidA (YjgF/YER057c/UK114 family)
MSPETMKVPPTLEEVVGQAFTNINDVILYALEKANHPAAAESNKTGWDRGIKLRTYHVNLPETRDKIIELMVQHVKKWCPNHTPTWTMLGVYSLPFPEQNLEIEVDVYLG